MGHPSGCVEERIWLSLLSPELERAMIGKLVSPNHFFFIFKLEYS